MPTTSSLRGRLTSTLGVILLGVLPAGCSGLPTAQDKAGNATITLRLASIDAVDSNGQAFGPETFVRALEEVSGGRVRVEVDTTTFAGPEPDAESRLVDALEAGEVDGGWPSTRAFAEAGIPGLEVVEAPFVLTSHEAVADLVTSPAASVLLARLDATGVVGLGLAAGPLRRPFATTAPLLGADDWRGQTFRSYNSPTQDATILALGATPVRVTHEWDGLARAGRLRGVEIDVPQYEANGLTTEAGHVTGNVVLWPKVFVLSISRRTWEGLHERQRGWVREAAARAVAASVAGPHDDHGPLVRICRDGARAHLASEAELRSLEEAVAPVLARMAEDPLFDEIATIAARHPDTGSLDPARCRAPVSTRRVEHLDVPTTPADLPSGVYRVEIDRSAVEASGIGSPAEGITGVWTLTVDGQEYAVDCTPLRDSTGIDCTYGEELPPDFDYNPREVGRIAGGGSTVYFTHDMALEARLTDCDPTRTDGPTSCFPTSTNRLTWQLDGDILTFGDLVAEEPAYYFVAAPWRRIS